MRAWSKGWAAAFQAADAGSSPAVRLYFIGGAHMKVDVVLEHKGTKYAFTDGTAFETVHAAEWWWEEGEGSCDCNRSIRIQQNCDPEFPQMDCGDDGIKLVSLNVQN